MRVCFRRACAAALSSFFQVVHAQSLTSSFRSSRLVSSRHVTSRHVTALAAVPFVTACGEKATAPAPQVPEPGIVTVKPASVPGVVELPGRVSAYLVAAIISRVDGIVLRGEFVEGAEVKAGQRLDQIGPAPCIATLNSARATPAKAPASPVFAHAQTARHKALVAANALSRQDCDNAVAAEGEDAADVAAGKAAPDTAQINPGYTHITAPVTGRTGKSTVTPGAFEEVANGRAVRGTHGRQVASLQAYQQSGQRRHELSGLRYHNGVDSYLTVLTAQTGRYMAQQSLITASLARLARLVDLHQDMGGGWIRHTDDQPRPADASRYDASPATAISGAPPGAKATG